MKNQHKNRVFRSLTCALLCSTGPAAHAAAPSESHPENLTTKLSRAYLKSFAAAKLPAAGAKPLPTQGGPKRVQLAPSTQRKVVLRTLFSDISPNQPSAQAPVLNDNVWHDLSLFSGPATHPKHHVLACINDAHTVAGECALATMLATPTADIPTLLKRQSTVRFFLDHPELLEEMQTIFRQYRSAEPSLLSLWTATDPLYAAEYRTYMHKRFLTGNPASDRVASKLKRRIFFRNVRDVYGEFASLPVFGVTWCGLNYLGNNVFSTRGRGINFSDVFDTFPLFVPGWSVWFAAGNYNKVKQAGGDPSFLPFLGVTATHGLAVWRGYRGVKQYQEYASVFQNLAQRMQDVQMLVQTLQRISDAVAKQPALEAAYGNCLAETRSLLQRRHESSELGTLVRNLLTLNLDGWSYFRSNGAALLATQHLFEAYKDHLKPALYELGQLDGLMGIARLVQKAKKTCPTHGYTFTQFLDRSEQKTPSIQLRGMWNPLLDPQTVVDNDVTMDATRTRNVILCGPNAGGKSSFLSGLATNVLLSQTFGIAAAAQATLTPFNAIHTYVELGDNIASGSSLFMVEVERMQEHIRLLQNSHPETFVFAIFDEPFAGTNPAEASASAYSTLAHMAQYPNALHVVASHYPILMRLEQNVPGRGIRNFKVCVEATEDRKLHYTYKIVPGAATQTVGIRILEEKGYAKKVVEQAKEMTHHPEKFYGRVGPKSQKK